MENDSPDLPLTDARGRADADLVRRAKAGDPDSFGEMYETYRDQLYRYCVARTRTPQEAEDLVSDVFLKGMQALGRYDDRGAPLLAFFYKIARNAAIDRTRTRRDSIPVDEMLLQPVSPVNVETAVEGRDTRALLAGALETLKAEYRDVLVLRFIEGYSAADAAKLLGKNESAIRSLQHRGHEKLRQVLTKSGGAGILDQLGASGVSQ